MVICKLEASFDKLSLFFFFEKMFIFLCYHEYNWKIKLSLVFSSLCIIKSLTM